MSGNTAGNAALDRNALQDPILTRSFLRRHVLSPITRLVKIAALVLFSPVRLFLSIRRSMTGASVTLLLAGIISLNIIWGYPWSGMFSACTALIFVGWAINQLMRPNLKIDFSLPNSCPAGQPFVVVTHARNRGRLPAMDLAVGFADPPMRVKRKGFGAKRKKAIREKAAHNDFEATKTPGNLSLIHPAQRIDMRGSLLFRRRGIHPLPDVVVTSMFPFHLFQSKQVVPSETSIAVTPPLLTGEEDEVARGLLNTLGAWSRRLLAGDALDYTGSREYEVGMTVRRWDFTSWARLGRPIVREFQSPSIQTVMLVVDTSTGEKDASDAGSELLERVLSLAATAVTDLTRRRVQIGLYLTSESASQLELPSAAGSSADSESLLIRLAAAEAVAADVADKSLREAVGLAGNQKMLVLTARHDNPIADMTGSNVTILRVDPAQPRRAATIPRPEFDRSSSDKSSSDKLSQTR